MSFIENTFRRKIESLRNGKIPITTVQKKLIYFTLPYISLSRNKNISRELQNLIAKFYPQISLRIVFRNSFSIGSFFRYSDRMPSLLRSCVIYKYVCSQCQATYYGETVRHFTTRIAEHRGVSVRTGNWVTNPLHSNIRDHSIELDHPIHVDSFEIVSSCDKPSVKLLESILIHQFKPTLNDAASSVPLNILA
jgi:hypothetical protein